MVAGIRPAPTRDLGFRERLLLIVVITAAALIVTVASHRWNAAQCQQQNNRQKHVFQQYVPKHVCSMIDRSAQIGIGCAINYAPRDTLTFPLPVFAEALRGGREGRLMWATAAQQCRGEAPAIQSTSASR